MSTNIEQRKEQLSQLRSQLSQSSRGALEKRLRAALHNDSHAEIIPRRTIDGPAPLSFLQQGIWIVEQLQPGTAAYNVPTVLRLKGDIDVPALNLSLNEILRRHESLRTSFVQVDGEPCQVVAATVLLNLPLDDLTYLPEEAKETEARKLAKEEIHRPFDLTQSPLLRARLIKLEDDDHVLVLAMHHIISDVWSVGILIRELATLYSAHSKSETARLPELPVQYPDFAVWQRNYLQGETFADNLNYWKQQLSDAPRILELPTDYPRPARLSHRGAVEIFSLPDALSDSLRQLSLNEGTTLFMTMLTAFTLLLSRYSNQKDIVVGCDIAGRNRAELEGVIGFFVNTIALRTDLKGDPGFCELLARVRESCLGAFSHQELPFERLVAELQPERASSYSPIFQVMFSLQSRQQQRAQEGNWNGLRVGGFRAKAETSMFDMSVRVIETQRNLAVTMEYSTDLFESETIKRMASQFRVLLASIVARRHDPISSLPILSDGERAELLESLGGKRSEYPQTHCIHELFEQQARKSPDAIALSFDSKGMTYRELDARANQLARHLQTLGAGPETLVGICMERSPEMIVGLLGILKAGAAYLPLDPEYPQERLAFMLEDATVQALLTQERLAACLPSCKAPVVCLDSGWPEISQQSPECVSVAVTPENLAYVIYTSGSTGRPKGVAVTHANVGRLLASTDAEFQFDEHDVWTLFHSYAFDFSVWEIWGALIYGGKLVIVPYLVSRSPEKFYELLCVEGVTVLNQTPSAFRQLTRVDETRPTGQLENKLRVVIFGGEALDVASLRDWFTRHPNRPELINMYGITETTVHVTHRKVTATDVGASYGSPIGAGLSDLRVYVLDDDMQLAPAGVPGELYVGGAGVARGYLKRPSLTAERFVPDPYGREPGARLYRTGDRARYLRNFELEFLGRADFQVKIRGFRIELGEIEAALTQHAAVQDAVVIAREDSPGHKRLIAYLIPAGSDLDILTVRGFIASRLPDYMVPALFVTLGSFPLTPSGKLDRKALPAPESNRPTVSTDFVAPRSSLEQDLADIWIRLLGIERVGIYDNFFELGGHSLLLTRLATRIRDKFGVDVPMRVLFDAPTIEDISVSILSQLMDQTGDDEIAVLLGELDESSAEEVIAG